MKTAQLSEHFHVGKSTSAAANRSEQLAADARQGVALSRALIQHVWNIGAAGYDNEIVVDGEVWRLQATRKAPAS